MGYRVGFQCFDTVESATDYKMSQVTPFILSDGSLVYPQKIKGVWTYQGQVIELSHGHCDPKEDLQAGLYIAAAYLGLFVLVASIRFVLKFINLIDVSERDERD